MRYDVEASFTAATSSDTLLQPGAIRECLLFHPSANASVFRRLGAPADASVVPWVLEPTNVFFQEIRRKFSASGLGADQKKPPYAIHVGDEVGRASLRVKVFPPNVAVVTVVLRGLSVTEDGLAAGLIEIQRMSSTGLVPSLIKWSTAMVSSLEHRSYSERPVGRVIPALRIITPYSQAELVDWTENHRRELAATLIRDDDYKASDLDLTNIVLGKNIELNRKADYGQWLDKQGALLASGPGGKRDPDFERVLDLQMLVLGMQVFLRTYSANRRQAPHLFDLVLARIVSWVNEPDRILTDSVGTRQAWKLLRSEFALDHEVSGLLTAAAVRARLDASLEALAHVGSAWWMEDDLEAYLTQQSMSDDRTPFPSAAPQIIQIVNAAQAQVAAGDINNYGSFDELLDDLAVAVERVQGVDESAKAEARGILKKLRATSGTVATAAAGSAGGALLGTALKQILGIP